MSAGPSDRERISALETHYAQLDREVNAKPDGLRDRVHKYRNELTAAKLDADALEQLAKEVATIKRELGDRKAQENLLVAIVKSPPVWWLATAAATLWAVVTGRLEL